MWVSLLIFTTLHPKPTKPKLEKSSTILQKRKHLNSWSTLQRPLPGLVGTRATGRQKLLKIVPEPRVQQIARTYGCTLLAAFLLGCIHHPPRPVLCVVYSICSGKLGRSWRRRSRTLDTVFACVLHPPGIKCQPTTNTGQAAQEDVPREMQEWLQQGPVGAD